MGPVGVPQSRPSGALHPDATPQGQHQDSLWLLLVSLSLCCGLFWWLSWREPTIEWVGYRDASRGLGTVKVTGRSVPFVTIEPASYQRVVGAPEPEQLLGPGCTSSMDALVVWYGCSAERHFFVWRKSVPSQLGVKCWYPADAAAGLIQRVLRCLGIECRPDWDPESRITWTRVMADAW